MVVTVKNLVISIFCAGVVILTGCASNAAAPVVSTAQPAKQTAAAQPQSPAGQPPAKQDPTAGYAISNNPSASGAKTAELLSNRVDVIYFHVNQRCVTCLCFEEHVNNVIGKYFGDAITGGKLTYRVLNAQLSQNVAIAKKYGAVGSQLFINAVVNGFDNIEDIQDIWNWDCRNNSAEFELKVKNIIEQRLKGQR